MISFSPSLEESTNTSTNIRELQRKISTVSFKDVPDVKMRDISNTEAQYRLTAGSSNSTSFSADEDSLSCQEFNDAEIEEIRRMKENHDVTWANKSQRKLTKTEKKLKKEQAMQRR